MFVSEVNSSISSEASAGKRQRAGAVTAAAAVGCFLLSSVVLSGKFDRSGFLSVVVG